MTQLRKQDGPAPESSPRRDFTRTLIVGGLVAGLSGFGFAVRAEMNGRDSLPPIVLAACGGMLVLAAITGKAWQHSKTQRSAVLREAVINYEHFRQHGHSLQTAETLEQRHQDSKVPVAERRKQLEEQWDKTRPKSK